MGVPKHNKDSARSKSSAKYKAAGRREINRAERQKKLAEGKRVKRNKEKTQDMKADTLIRGMIQSYNDKVDLFKPKKLNKNCVR